MFDHEMSVLSNRCQPAEEPIAEDSPKALSRELANYAALREQQRQLNAQWNGARKQPKPGLATK